MTTTPNSRALPAIPVNAANSGITLTLFTGLSLVCYIDRFIMGALVTPVKLDLGLTDEQVGRTQMMFNLAYIIAGPIFGYVGDRLSRKWLILFGVVLWSTASVGSGLAYTLGALLFWRAAVGVGEGVFSSLAPGWLADTFVPKVRNIAFSVFNSTGKVGATIGVAAGGWIAAKYGWHTAFFVAGLPGLILAFALLVLREPLRGGADGHHTAPERPTVSASLSIFKRPNYLLHIFGYTAYMLALAGLNLWGPAYMHRVFGVSNGEATGFFGVGYSITGLPGAFIGGYLLSLLQRRTRAGYSTGLTVAMLLVTPILIAAFTTTSLDTFRALIWTEIFLFGLCSAAVTTAIFETVPPALRGAAISGSMILSTGLGGYLSSELIGIISDRSSLGIGMFLTPVGTILAAAIWGVLGWRQRGEDKIQQVESDALVINANPSLI